ncbi:MULTISPECIES: DUF2147 domain-containing protein [unclassified Cupriavidus]|uniref:DUF2147 domain-containing protein n=1 Tax=unclassified Cupriavidus TaxID=2640874 RepID=UPI0010F4A28E|nr:MULTISPECIES: DUF2147 domain-containing protein [unclassified Cupriavidus]MWL88456.1 DUF2147 domain-containing protein [Cupriavidus sp. SW-Y-13]
MRLTDIRALLRAAILASTFVGTMAASAMAAAQATPAGTWHTIDDTTGKPRGVIEITEKDGVYSGKLVKSLVPTEGKPSTCEKCTDSRKDQPIIGMTILTGLKKTGDNEWTGGEILDPEAGKLYKCKMSLADDGKTLNVRGFIGISLIGRTQSWIRQQ